MKLAESESFSLSPDGKTLAYPASDTDQVLRIWVQSLDALEPRLLPGTEIHGGGPPPIWSPDSKFLAFDSGGKLKKVDLNGSPPVTICSTTGIVLGGAWSRQGVIIFGNEKGGLMRVSERGGNAVPLTTMDRTRGEVNHGFPTILPDGRHFVYSRFSSVRENTGVYVGSLDSQPGEQGLKQVVATPYTAQFVALPNGNGKLLFLRDGTVWAQDLDTSRFDLIGRAGAGGRECRFLSGTRFLRRLAGRRRGLSEPETASSSNWPGSTATGSARLWWENQCTWDYRRRLFRRTGRGSRCHCSTEAG